MSTATIVTLIGGTGGVVFHAVLAQGATPVDAPGWLTSVGVGGSLALIFWIVASELPANRKARRESHEKFAATLDKMATNFHEELKSERAAAALERIEYMKERSADREARHASANALNNVALAVTDLGERIEERKS